MVSPTITWAPWHFRMHWTSPHGRSLLGKAARHRASSMVCMPDGRLRRLTPVELERLKMFPDGHTAGTADGRRAFLMGNALVTGVIERVGKVLERRVKG